MPWSSPRYRSAAVARMVRMPVATLRIWERRYGVVAPETSAAGHRLYSAEQVQRLALLKQLTELGHAIGEVAGLDMAGLQQVAATHVQALARSQGQGEATPWRVTLVDACGIARWQPVGLRLERPLQWVAVHHALEDLLLAGGGDRDRALACDTLIVALPHLQPDDVPRLQSAARACGAKRIGVRHAFAASALVQRLRSEGMALLREPADEAAVLAWLRSMAGSAESPVSSTSSASQALARGAALVAAAPALPGPRRYDDATLAAFAQLSTTIACECPRHVAELLMQLTHFEAYSAECEHRSTEDAALHRYLQQVAASARSLFESALERVAQHEGLMVPVRPVTGYGRR